MNNVVSITDYRKQRDLNHVTPGEMDLLQALMQEMSPSQMSELAECISTNDVTGYIALTTPIINKWRMN